MKRHTDRPIDREGSNARTATTILVTLAWILCTQLTPATSGGSRVFIGDDEAYKLVCQLASQTEERYNEILVEKPYDPSLYAWGMQYLARGYLALFQLTHNRTWLERALEITDYFERYSDVNGDGTPCWGNYNETFGHARYGWREFTVWDGVIALPMVEAAKLIWTDPSLSIDPNLSEKAARYVNLAKAVVHYHRPCWTQVAEDEGYYWDDTSEDIGPVTNSFAALGCVEILLADLTGDPSFLERPRQMVKLMLEHMQYDPVGDLYVWGYRLGSPPAEDISHGAIDLQFLLLAHSHGLLDDQHILRICNTHVKRIWQVPNLLERGFPLSMRIDGTGNEDYTTYCRGWVLLSDFVPLIYEQQRIALGIEHERYGLYPSGWIVLSISQILLQHDRLASAGINPDRLEAVSRDELQQMFDKVHVKLLEAQLKGANTSIESRLLERAHTRIQSEPVQNASVPIANIWEAWDGLEQLLLVAEGIDDLRLQIDDAEKQGADLDQVKRNLSELILRFQQLDSGSVRRLDPEIEALRQETSKALAWALIQQAESIVSRAEAGGLDVSRHRLFLECAKREYFKGNYGPAVEWTRYPLSLRSQVGQPKRLLLIACLTTTILLFKARWQVASHGDLDSDYRMG